MTQSAKATILRCIANRHRGPMAALVSTGVTGRSSTTGLRHDNAQRAPGHRAHFEVLFGLHHGADGTGTLSVVNAGHPEIKDYDP